MVNTGAATKAMSAGMIRYRGGMGMQAEPNTTNTPKYRAIHTPADTSLREPDADALPFASRVSLTALSRSFIGDPFVAELSLQHLTNRFAARTAIRRSATQRIAPGYG